MKLLNVLTDVKVWAATGLILGLLIGFDSPDAATMLMIVLILQMTLSLEGVSFHRSDFADYKKQILGCVIGCFVLNTGLTLITGMFFIDNTALWYGWVMLASVPCGVSVVSGSIFVKGDTKLSVLGLTGVYFCALALTPIITHAFIGDAVSPLDILKYILMFILIPFIASIPLKKLHMPASVRIIGINILMLLMVFVAVGSRRDYIFSYPDVVLWLVIACTLRLIVFSVILVYLFKKIGYERRTAMDYILMAIWKNSGMSISMTMALIAPMYPEAVLPCVISLAMEMVWFTFFAGVHNRIWPIPESDKIHA